jgi:hypothetical protein
VVLIKAHTAPVVMMDLLNGYRQQYPDLAEKAVAFVAQSGGGLRIVDDLGFEIGG